MPQTPFVYFQNFHNKDLKINELFQQWYTAYQKLYPNKPYRSYANFYWLNKALIYISTQESFYEDIFHMHDQELFCEVSKQSEFYEEYKSKIQEIEKKRSEKNPSKKL